MVLDCSECVLMVLEDGIHPKIIPLGSEGTTSLFVKMTGPTETVQNEANAIASFLKSLKLNL